MGAANPMIVSVVTPGYGRIVLDASDGMRYHADLSTFSRVYCYPRSKDEWDRVAPDAQGLALVWTSRFEVHIDQVIGLADRMERIRQTA